MAIKGKGELQVEVKPRRRHSAADAASFLPSTRAEMDARGWDHCDVVLITGDAYIDAPAIGVAVVGRVLEAAGFRVGVIGQPRVDDLDDIARLGEPRLFWGVTGGSVDSLVANYTATKKVRNSDDYTPGGINDRRPDRAALVYVNLIRRAFKSTVPIVLGGIEASLRRVTHYDFWTDRLRRPILFDAKADILVYGMAERTVRELAAALAAGREWRDIRGLGYVAAVPPAGDGVELPSHEACVADQETFIDLFTSFSAHADPLSARRLCQPVGDRFLVQNPPAPWLTEAEMDAVAALPYTRELHPVHAAAGPVRALDTIRFSITTHHGCWGGCSFCAIGVHQGRTVRSRSASSIVAEARNLAARDDFRGVITDVGGPTANMYGTTCARMARRGACTDRRCVGAKGLCPSMQLDHGRQIGLLRELRTLPGVRHVFVASGIRHDLVLADLAHGEAYLAELIRHHVSGQLKIAPEHCVPRVLELMGKPPTALAAEFKRHFDRLTKRVGKRQFLTYYFIAAHPGCTAADMRSLQSFVHRELQITPEQVQTFTPTPGTWSSVMYYTGLDPWTRKPIFVEHDRRRREQQKEIVVGKSAATGRKPRR
ncbi:MAG: YgiQ family radical SAM protein [Deltaproteobacteria bacterium]|nr:YgiQ family radical SAM protein [Candidatus Anaeroferrophillacea bacterium]